MVAGQQQQQQQQVLRQGKWTPAEEEYATRLIQEFQAGILPLIEGTSIHTFLSEFLYCAPTRITRKLRLGVQVYQRGATAESKRVTPAQLQQIWADLNDLERRFVGRDPVDTQQFRACVLAKSTCFITPIGSTTGREQEDRPQKKYKTSPEEEKKKDATTNQQHHEYCTSENERERISEHTKDSKKKNQEKETDDTFCEIDDYGLLRVPTYHIYTYSESTTETASPTTTLVDTSGGGGDVVTGSESSSNNAIATATATADPRSIRIRTPLPQDVLSDRGMPINLHPGNKLFRDWVNLRREDYHLARTKTEKLAVVMGVVRQVQQQQPCGGRFLIKDPSSLTEREKNGPWWVELSEVQTLAKIKKLLQQGGLARKKKWYEQGNTKEREFKNMRLLKEYHVFNNNSK